jgi:hypothetical protein
MLRENKMEESERTRLFELQTRRSYELLGQFVAEFELLVFTIRTSLERDLGSPGQNHFAIQNLTAHLTAWPLGQAFHAHALSRTKGNLKAISAIERFWKDFEYLVTLRNDVVHGTHFIGWASIEDEDFSNPTMLRSKPGAKGAVNKVISISHSSMETYISSIKKTNKLTFAIGANLVMQRWDQNFDAEGNLLEGRF